MRSATLAGILLGVLLIAPELRAQLYESYADSALDAARSLIEYGLYDEAAATLDDGLKHAPNSTDLIMERANLCFFDLEENDCGYRMIGRLLKLEPKNGVAHALRGYMQVTRDGDEEGLEEIEMGDRLEPDNGWILHALAEAYQYLGDYEQAEVAIDHAIDVEPDNVRHYQQKGLLYFEAGMTDEGLAVIDQAIAVDPTAPYSWFMKGEHYAEVWQYDSAHYYYAKALDLSPDWAEALAADGDMLNALQKYDQAAARYADYMQFDLSNADVYVSYSRALSLQGKKDEAFSLLENALTYLSDHPLIYFELAQVELERKHRKEACAYLDQAIEYGIEDYRGDEAAELKMKTCK